MSLTGNAKAEHKLRGKINRLDELRGYSAYELALIHGYKGTEEEWLEYISENGYAKGVEKNLNAHTANKSNPHGVTTAQIGAVPTSRKVNGKALSSDITLSAADVRAVALDGSNTMTGPLNVNTADSPAVRLKHTGNNDDAEVKVGTHNLQIKKRNVAGNDANYRRLLLSDSQAYTGVRDALKLGDMVNGEETFYDVLHSGNIAIYAAPAGYYTSINPVSSDDALDTTMKNFVASLNNGQAGFFIIDVNVVGLGLYGGRWYIEVIKHNDTTALFTCKRPYDGDQLTVYRTLNGGTLEPFEWENPPMEAGIEYRTTERSGGLPVYAKRVAYQVTTNISGQVTLEIPHGISGYRYLVRHTGRANAYVLPCFGMGSYCGISTLTSTNIVFVNNGSTWNPNYTFTFDLYYTKS